MVDFSKCPGTNCPMRPTCERFTAPRTSTMQSYTDFKYDNAAENCVHYMHDPQATNTPAPYKIKT